MAEHETVELGALDSVAAGTLANQFALSLYGAISLACLRAHGQDRIADVQARVFAINQEAHFLRGLKRIDLDDEASDAVRCGKYHYLTNLLSGLGMEYVEESPTKVWIRYRAPYWTFDSQAVPSTALAAVQPRFSEEMFRAWHGNNGRLLGNDRLAFVHTQNAADGDPWDGGYFIEHDEPVAEDQRYRRSPGEWGPRFDPTSAPQLPASWNDPERMARGARTFALGFIATILGVLSEEIGDTAGEVARHALAITLVQNHRTLGAALGVPRPTDCAGAAQYLGRLLAALGDEVQLTSHGDRVRLEVTGPTLLGLPRPLAAGFEAAIIDAWRPLLRLWDLYMDITPVRSGDEVGAWELAVAEVP